MRSFIPATDEVWRLQNRKDPDCNLFMGFARQGHYPGGGTKQGIYACTPSGVFLGSCNSNNPSVVARMMRDALKKWAATPARLRYLAQDPAKTRVARRLSQYPEDGLVLKVITRDLPRAVRKTGRMKNAWNVQFAWFRKTEVRQLMPARIERGAVHDIPKALVERIVRFHLVDNVHGQTISYKSNEVIKAALATQVVRVRRGAIELRFKGESETRAGSRGYKATLYGTAKYNLARQRFASFTLVAKGMRTGGTRYNFRQGDPGPQPLGVVFVLGKDTPQEHVTPYFLGQYGWK